MKLIQQEEFLKEVNIEGMIVVLPIQYNWVSVDSDGTLVGFESEPFIRPGQTYWNYDPEATYKDHESVGVVNLEGKDWKTCLWKI